jgi:glutamine phosphoribosylpyrophosphate amidotransferase
MLSIYKSDLFLLALLVAPQGLDDRDRTHAVGHTRRQNGHQRSPPLRRKEQVSLFLKLNRFLFQFTRFRIALVHNGVIQNFIPLKKHLEKKGIQFVSQTDTEVIAQLV